MESGEFCDWTKKWYFSMVIGYYSYIEQTEFAYSSVDFHSFHCRKFAGQTAILKTTTIGITPSFHKQAVTVLHSKFPEKDYQWITCYNSSTTKLNSIPMVLSRLGFRVGNSLPYSKCLPTNKNYVFVLIYQLQWIYRYWLTRWSMVT